MPRRLSAVRKVHLGALSLDKVLMVILLRSTLVVLFPRGGGAVRRCLCEKTEECEKKHYICNLIVSCGMVCLDSYVVLKLA